MQPRRSAIDQVRTIFWFQFVLKSTGCQTAFELERLIEPDSFSTNPEGGTKYKNKCSKYKTGKHTPSSQFTQKVEAKFAPGSSQILNMPLWDAFKLDFHKLMKSSIFLRLPEIVQSKIFGLKSKQSCDQLPSYTSNIGKKLVRLGSFDSLCALIIFWRIDQENQEHPNREKLAINIYHLLLIVANELKKYSISELVFHLFRINVFDQAHWNGKQFNLDYKKFEENRKILNIYWENHASKMKPRLKRNMELAEILQSTSKIFPLNAILNDVFRLNEQALPPRREIWLRIFYEHLKSCWAHSILYDKNKTSLIEKIYNITSRDNRFNEADITLILVWTKIESMKNHI